MRTLDELLRQPPRAAQLTQFILARAASLASAHARLGVEARLARRAAVREGIIEALGLARIPQAPVRIEYLDLVELDGYVVQKLVYEAIPGLTVPAHLYVPASKPPHPGVVHAPGHWMENGKLEPDLQRLNAGLARRGIAVLCLDTLGQGERRVGWHQHGQLAPLLVGFTTLGVMVRESLAGLDVLAAAPGVASDRLGMTGTSGGGFSTIFAATIDERIRASAIACIVNTHLGQLQDAAIGTGWDGWVDLCNQVPGLCALASMGEIIAAAAPRDVAIVHADDDPPFPVRGARAVADEVRALYEAGGLGERFEYVEVSGSHGLHPAVRDAITDFLTSRLGGQDLAGHTTEVPFPPLWTVTHDVASADRPQTRAEDVAATGRCLVQPLDTNEVLVQLARARADELRRREPMTADRLRALVGAFPARQPLTARVTNHIPLEDEQGQRLVYEPEDGIALDAVFLLPDDWSDDLPPVFVMLDEGGKEAALACSEVSRARERGAAILLPDLRGTGESAASEFELATAAWMLDRDLLNQRVWDVLRTVDCLSERYSTGQQIAKDRIVVWGRGAFGLIALLAGVLDPRVAACGATGLETLESLLVRNSRSTPMAYRYRLLEVLDIADLVRLAHPRGHLAPDDECCADVVEAALAGRHALIGS